MPRFEEAIAKFDAANSEDPHRENGEPRELLYARRLGDWVERLAPGASEALRLAARCQHICRWQIPRSSYPDGRAGYLRWREELKKFHARKAGEILCATGFDDATVEKVQALNLKKDFPKDPESQVLEDALCLVFVEHQLPQIASEHPEKKVIEILQKTWKKMSPRAREIALGMPIGKREKELVEKSLSAEETRRSQP